jgi:hypothetical protein
MEVGIDDVAWRKGEDEGEAQVLSDTPNRVSLPGTGESGTDEQSLGLDHPNLQSEGVLL